jgi:release factor glutamine methyltransferase
MVEAAAALAAAGIDEPRRHARRRAAAALDLAPGALIAEPERPVTPAERARLAGMLARMVAHEPLSRIVGRREFWGLDLALSPDTLDPRPDSETVIEAVLRRRPDHAAPLACLDLGTGSGCLLLALLAEFPAASGIGIDIAPGAAMTARANAAALGFAGRACFVVGDWASALRGWASALRGGFDVVVANPPYIATREIAALPRAVADYDPHRALDGGDDGLAAYRAIAADLPRLLRPAGIFAGEIGIGQGPAVAALLRHAGLAVDGIDADLSGIGRCIVACPAGLRDASSALPR